MRIAFLATMIFAAAGLATAQAPAGPFHGQATSQPAPMTEELSEQLIAALKLSDEQGPKVRKMLADHRKEMAEWLRKFAPEMGQLRTQMRMIHTSKDPKAVTEAKAAMARYRQLQSEQRMKRADLLVRLNDVLSNEQFATARKMLFPQPQSTPQALPFHLLGKLALTEQQKARLKTIMDEARDTRTKGQPDAMGKAWNRIVQEVLTDKDRKELSELNVEAAHRRMALAMLGGVKLTPEQLRKIDGTYESARAKAAKDPNSRRAVYAAAQREIIEKVLTDEQRKALEKQKTQGPPRMGPHGAGGTMPPAGM